MATPTAAPATRLRRLRRDAARASRSSSLLGAMASEARGSPRAPEPAARLAPGSGSPLTAAPGPPRPCRLPPQRRGSPNLPSRRRSRVGWARGSSRRFGACGPLLTSGAAYRPREPDICGFSDGWLLTDLGCVLSGQLLSQGWRSLRSPATQTDLSWPERGLVSALWTSGALRWGGTHRTRPPPRFARYLWASTDPPSYPSRAPGPCWSSGPARLSW